MKKLFLLIAIAVSATIAKAQDTSAGDSEFSDYRKFKFDFMVGWALPSMKEVNKGVVGLLEPHYAIKDNFDIGLRIEGAEFQYSQGSTIYGTRVSITTSYCATGKYYLGPHNTFRPFIGGGAGLFSTRPIKYYSFAESDIQAPPVHNVGFYPEVGFELGHLKIAANYNVVGGNASYGSIKIGFFLGGGGIETDD